MLINVKNDTITKIIFTFAENKFQYEINDIKLTKN